MPNLSASPPDIASTPDKGAFSAGQRAAVIQSLLGAAKLNGLDPAAWLKDTLEKLPTGPNRRIDALLPLGLGD